MNHTTSNAQITITTAQPVVKTAIQKRVIYNAHGKARTAEFLRGIQI